MGRVAVGVLSKVRMSGFASKAGCAGPDRRLIGTALSAKLSTKSRTIKSLLEKFSRVKLGPLGNRLLAPMLVRSMVRRRIGRSPIVYMCRAGTVLFNTAAAVPVLGIRCRLALSCRCERHCLLEYGGASTAQPHWWLLRHTKTQAHVRLAAHLIF